MRELIKKWTVIAAVSVVVTVVATEWMSGTPWPLLILRSGLALGIIVLAGWCASLVLMRTALRRYYEQRRTAEIESRPRSQR
ncbi:MAG: hypothetical protein E6K77_00175 [Candidatus Eisenbacteria bacterium]|uniref:Uncharacterized protein n=1 Tax=Eiseniibacteriota bacterium TaxID=2212470 RepID=A0A538TU59_UNCEI|nr:MAG: hypothetical protein E6K77_00175 [Candidatus Eisenbacteria bacterium]